MSAQPWHRRYHSDALAGMLSLTLEERGAYQTVLDLIYDRRGAIMDNERLLAGYMGVSIRKWRSLRAELLAKGKIHLTEDGLISNSRAEKELENDAKTSRKHAENGSSGGRKKAENSKKPNENNGNDVAKLEQNPSLLPEARSQSITLPKGNDHEPASDKQFWDTAKAYLGGKNPGALVGKWIRDNGKSETAAAITAAQVERAVDPVPYIEKILRKQAAFDPMDGFIT